MSGSADRALLDALAALERALGGFGAPYMVIGGIAVIARGVPRQTADVDATVNAEGIDLDGLFARLALEEIVGRIPDAVAFAKERQVLLLRHNPSSSPLEITLGWLPFEIEAIGQAERLDFGGVVIPVARAEDLIVYKAVAWRDRDRADIERLLSLHGATVDLTRVRRIIAEFADALEEPQRIAEFEALVQRAPRGE